MRGPSFVMVILVLFGFQVGYLYVPVRLAAMISIISTIVIEELIMPVVLRATRQTTHDTIYLARYWVLVGLTWGMCLAALLSAYPTLTSPIFQLVWPIATLFFGAVISAIYLLLPIGGGVKGGERR